MHFGLTCNADGNEGLFCASRSTGQVVTGFRTPAEISVGVIYGVGAVFNSVYTLSHGDEFYGSFADGAWLGPARWLVDNVVLSNTTVFTAALIVFQIAVAVTILTRSELVVAALIAGAAFSVLAALASSPGGTVGNLLLAALQAALAFSR